ncbi:DUF6122 family protein [Ichthyenterobacterium magnum]|uniref:LexA-binding, inner membrane-associated hydrolase n=1 Tax=Ichthyenterobacterium magnum TaxID=1230530 RepID=A0A420DGV0_9FLAO|nr:DUF6122 family protein [Ichthyenterobacterium magnum]RKE92306.1 hypothetical protein BXY80_2225 [Ichthyenterobacterium magnum]
MLQPILHYSIHIGLPLVVALLFFKSNWKTAFLIMIATMAIDLDHLIANPIFDPNRCSINFHPLHTYYAMVVYALLLCFKKTRIVGIGLCIHMLADATDCLLM